MLGLYPIPVQFRLMEEQEGLLPVAVLVMLTVGQGEQDQLLAPHQSLLLLTGNICHTLDPPERYHKEKLVEPLLTIMVRGPMVVFLLQVLLLFIALEVMILLLTYLILKLLL
jgi:hypothetical protein